MAQQSIVSSDCFVIHGVPFAVGFVCKSDGVPFSREDVGIVHRGRAREEERQREHEWPDEEADVRERRVSMEFMLGLLLPMRLRL